MRKLILLTAGGAVGYLLGAKAGHERYESIRAQATTTVRDRLPTVANRIRRWRSDDSFGMADLIALDAPSGSTRVTRSKSVGSAEPSGPPFADLTTPAHQH
ncbi:MAG TPA: hypothetical protein VMT88_03435 [Actinomycetes bacterium]|nr:hypothetical protein [Actinomycetes bacterium]